MLGRHADCPWATVKLRSLTGPMRAERVAHLKHLHSRWRAVGVVEMIVQFDEHWKLPSGMVRHPSYGFCVNTVCWIYIALIELTSAPGGHVARYP